MPYAVPLAPIGIAGRKSTDSENLAALEEVAPCNVGASSDAHTIIAQHGSAVAEPTHVRTIAVAETPDRRYWIAYDYFMDKRETRARRRAHLYALVPRRCKAARRLFAWNAASWRLPTLHQNMSLSTSPGAKPCRQ